jgi:hypothetical protein
MKERKKERKKIIMWNKLILPYSDINFLCQAAHNSVNFCGFLVSTALQYVIHTQGHRNAILCRQMLLKTCSLE